MLTWWRGGRSGWHVRCAHCHHELAHDVDDLPDALALAETKARATPCCDAWTTANRTTGKTNPTGPNDGNA